MSNSPARRILVIDDDIELAKLFQELCGSQAYETRVAFSAKAGVELISEFLPHVVISRVRMSDLSGLEVARKIRCNEDSCQPWLIAVTGWSTPEVVQEILSAGFDVHLAKPVDFFALVALLKSCFDQTD